MTTPSLPLSAAALAGLALALSACDAGAPGPLPEPPPAVLTSAQRDLALAAFRDVEALGARGGAFAASSAGAVPASPLGRLPAAPVPVGTVPVGTLPAFPLRLASGALADTVTFTGVYDAVAAVGYLVTVEQRLRLGAPLYTARVQWGHGVAGAGGASGIETVTLTFLTEAPMRALLAGLRAGTVAYMRGTGTAEVSFAGADAWRAALLYAPSEGRAVVQVAASDGARAVVTVRDPVVTVAASGACTVRDGGPGGTVRTRTYEVGCAVGADGSVSGTLSRTVLSGVASSDGGVTTRTVDAATGRWTEVAQRGGDGIVVRSTTEGS